MYSTVNLGTVRWVRSSAPRSTRRDAVAHRAQIISAAFEVLAATPQAGLAAVATAAGLTRTTVYAHFPSRRELVTAMVEEVIDDGVAAWDAADPASASDSPSSTPDPRSTADLLPLVLRGTWRVLAGRPGIAAAAHEALGGETMTRLHEPITQRVHGLVRRGVADGSLVDDVTEDWLVDVWFAAVHAASHRVRAGTPTDVIERDLVRTLERVLLRRCAPPLG